MTTVVNIRFQKFDVYCGRAGHGYSGEWGNNHPIGWCPICKTLHGRDSSIHAYRLDFYERLKTDPEFKAKVLTLKDKRLGCFCKVPNEDIPCHCDVIAEYLNAL